MYRYFCIVVILCGLQQYSWATPANPVHVTFKLSKSLIMPGEAIHIQITAVNTSDRASFFEITGNHVFYPDAFRVCITGDSVSSVEKFRRKIPIYPWNLSKIMSCQIRAKESVSVGYPIHLQWDTHLPPGGYNVQIMPVSVIVEGTHHKVPGASMKLQVVDSDCARLVDKYEQLLETIPGRKVSTNRSVVESVDIMNIPIEALEMLCAYGKEPTQYQIQCLFNNAEGFAYWPEITIISWDNIYQHATMDVIDKLLFIVNQPMFVYGSEPGKHYDPGIIWCMHRIFESGDVKQKERLREVCGKMPENFNYDAVQYMNK